MHRTLVAALDRGVAIFACVLVTALLACVALGVLTRELGAPLIWTDEASRFLMVWLAVSGWILAGRRRMQVRIRYFHDRLPHAGRQGTEIAIQAALTLLGALIAAYSVGLVARNLDLEATTLPLSMAWMYVPMVLAGAATAAQGVVELVGVARGWGPRATAKPTADVE